MSGALEPEDERRLKRLMEEAVNSEERDEGAVKAVKKACWQVTAI